jgi:hypothetical protein
MFFSLRKEVCLLTTMPASAVHPRPRLSVQAFRGLGFGALALSWYLASTFAPLGIPSFVAIFILGVLVMLSVAPDSRWPTRGIEVSRRNVGLALLAGIAFVPFAMGMNLFLGRIPIESGHAVLATLAALCLVLARLADTREYQRPALLGHRELIVSVAALAAFVRSYQEGDLFVAMVAFAVLAPLVMIVRRARLGAASPRQLRRRQWALQAGNFCVFLALLGAASIPGTFFVWRIFAPGADALIVGAFWVGLAAIAVLVAFPRRRVSVATNVLIALVSIFLAVQLVRIYSGPPDAVTIGVPFTEKWEVASGGRSILVNSHWSLTVQRNAIDLVQLVDGKTYRGDKSRLQNFCIFGDPLLAVADGRVTAAVGSHPDLPVGGNTWDEMEGNHVILDIGGGRYVLYAHMKQGSLRVRAGDFVHKGQVIGQVGDSGNSDEPHLHIQVQNKPTFDVEAHDIRTYPMLFAAATAADLRRGDSVAPAEGGS